MDYWVHVDGSKALWYMETTTTYYWAFGPLAYLGTGSVNMYTASNTLKEKCPNNEGYVWNWIYFPASSGVATDDIYIKCANENDFCSSQNPCGTNQGDCDTHDECQDGLVCGSNNCPDSLELHAEFDCCYAESKMSPNSDLRKHQIPKHHRHLGKDDRMPRSRTQHFHIENEMLPYPNLRNHQMFQYAILTHLYNFHLEEDMLLGSQFRKKYIESYRIKKNITQYKETKGKINNHQLTKLKSNCQGKGITYQNSSIVCNHLASSVQGLRIKLNPNIEEYKTDALKNNFIGFKYLVHYPYDFPYVETVGKAMGPNIQSYIGFLGFHSWITDDADAYKPGQKNCASKHDIELDVFQDYTRKNCMFECQAKSFFKECACLPYQYPEFHLANTGIWKNVTSTSCNYTQLICLSNVKGTF